VFGVDLSTIPSVKAVLDDVENDRKIAVDRAKAQFKRKRPSAVDPSIQPCGEIRDMLSGYPSGHASYAYASGNILVAMRPRMANEILERSSSFAESRLVCGMHFRSDIMAGQYAGTAIADRMLEHPEFRARVDAAAEDLIEAMK
jgi:acid phosphatase (class A)